MEQRIIRTGHSAAVTIPSGLMKALSLRIGDRVSASPDYGKGAVTYNFLDVRQLPLVSRPELTETKKIGRPTK